MNLEPTSRTVQEKRTDVLLRIGEAANVLKLPAPREVHAYGNGVLSLYFDYTSEAKQWSDHLCLSDAGRMWRGWKTYVSGVA